MMPSHYEGSGEFPEILGNGRTMVEQGIWLWPERLPEVGNGCLLLEDTENSQARAVFKGLHDCS